MTITSMLSNTYSIESHAGKKTTCPFCNHNTFQIHHNNCFAKCFHPSCGKYLTLTNDTPLYTIALTLFNDFMGNLTKDNIAYQYLKTRHISDEVINLHKLGSVPKNYDLSKVCSEKLNEVNTLPRKTNTQKKYAQTQYDVITAFVGKYSKMLLSCENFLVFCYTDHAGNITKFKLRQPNTKNFKSIKITENDGVFGLHEQSADTKKLIILEGEFNLLRYQTVCSNGGISAIAVGGVSNVDYKTIEKCGSSFIICYDNDENQAGSALYKNWQAGNMSICTTPDVDSDLDSYVDSGADSAGITAIIDSAQPFNEPLESVVHKIVNLRESLNNSGKSVVEYQVYDKISEIIIAHLANLGKFLNVDNEPVYLPHGAITHITLDKTNPKLALLLADYGLVSTEKVWKYVFSTMCVWCTKFGSTPQTAQLAHFDGITKIVRINLFCGKYVRLSANSFEVLDNASENIFFHYNSAWQAINPDDLNPSNLDKHGAMDKFIFNPINFDLSDPLSVDERKMLCKAWVLSMFFPQLMHTKPLLTFIGQKGSGKSSAGRKIGRMLFGSKFEVTGLPEDPKDFECSTSTSPFMVLDNADSYRKWLNDALAILSTGGVYKRRILYTTAQYAEIPISTFAILTSRTPKFTRDDVADRCIIVNLERFPQSCFTPEHVLMKEITDNRETLWNDILIHCQFILKAMEHTNPLTMTSARMADFASFTHLYSIAFGGDLHKTFTNLENAQNNFSLSNDCLIDLLINTAEKNANQRLTAVELLCELKESDDSKILLNKYTPHSLIALLQQNKQAYSQHVGIDMRKYANRQWCVVLTPKHTFSDNFQY